MNTTFAERLDAIRGGIERAASRAGRKGGDVLLLPVSKKFGPDAVAEAAAAGLNAFGESRVQEAKQKIPLCPGHLSWHLVGHLQRNKVRDAVSLFSVIHSVDSPRLLEAIASAVEESGNRIRIFIEVNVSGESVKYGMPPREVPAMAEAAASLNGIEVAGLMTIPPYSEDPEDARPHFRRLRELRDSIRAGSGLALPELSMGMSGDYEVAIEEGSTCIRIGTALFGERTRIEHGGESE